MKRILTGLAVIGVLVLITACKSKTEESSDSDNMMVELVRAGVLDNIDNPSEASTNRQITEPIPGAVSATTTTTSTTVPAAAANPPSGRNSRQNASGRVVEEEVLPAGPMPASTTTTTVFEVRTSRPVPVQPAPVEPVLASPTTPASQAPASSAPSGGNAQTSTQTTVVGGASPVTVIQQTTIIQGNTVSANHTYPANCYIKVGRDAELEAAAPRQYTKITMAIFCSLPNAVSIDFQIYAIPASSSLARTGENMIGYAYNIEIINGQAQMTKYWNGKNVYGKFLREGNYNIYLYYKVKDANGNILKTDGRYWGNSRSYCIKLS